MKRSAKPGEARAFAEAALSYKGDECLLWPFSHDPDGYGYLQAKRQRRCWRVHRWVCEKTHGPKTCPTHGALHSCGNPKCVNPKHLRWGPPAENSADMRVHGTDPTGERNPAAKITAEVAVEIYNAEGTLSSIGNRYGISKGHVSNIKRGWVWWHVTGAKCVRK